MGFVHCIAFLSFFPTNIQTIKSVVLSSIHAFCLFEAEDSVISFLSCLDASSVSLFPSSQPSWGRADLSTRHHLHRLLFHSPFLSPISFSPSSLPAISPSSPQPPRKPTPGIPHAPKRTPNLTASEFQQAVRNALRYFPAHLHATLAPEFSQELRDEGHIYMRRFQPTEYPMKAHPLECYPAKTTQAACIQLMIMNNLDPEVAQYPEELITYGGQGSVLSNWAQYHLLMYYLSVMNESQTLTMYSGHPAGLFPSSPDAPRVVITNGMVIPNHSTPEAYDRMYAMGVTIYGQMTAGESRSWFSCASFSVTVEIKETIHREMTELCIFTIFPHLHDFPRFLLLHRSAGHRTWDHAHDSERCSEISSGYLQCFFALIAPFDGCRD